MSDRRSHEKGKEMIVVFVNKYSVILFIISKLYRPVSIIGDIMLYNI